MEGNVFICFTDTYASSENILLERTDWEFACYGVGSSWLELTVNADGLPTPAQIISPKNMTSVSI